MMLYQKQIITKTSGFAHKHKKVKKKKLRYQIEHT